MGGHCWKHGTRAGEKVTPICLTGLGGGGGGGGCMEPGSVCYMIVRHVAQA